MIKERIIKDYDNLGLRCCFAVQFYDKTIKLWRFKETYNAQGFNPHMPKWYDSRTEAESHFDNNAKIYEDAELGKNTDIYTE